MNKVFEYMSLGIPFVQFDLEEGRRLAGDAALYATDNSPASLADGIGRLADDDGLRLSLGEIGRKRCKALLRWDTERAQLLAAYEMALESDRKAAGAPAVLR